MNRKQDEQEPLLTAVARKLGQAAGTLANMTHLLTPEPVSKPSAASSEAPPDAKQSGQASTKKVDTSANTGQPRKTRSRQVTTGKRVRPASARSQNTSTGKKKASSRKNSRT